MLIFKIATAADWHAAERAGRFEGSAQDKADGFIHFSTASQLPETLRRYYADVTGIKVVAVDDTQLGAALKWEHAPSRGEDFPHLYGPLPMQAVQCTIYLSSVRELDQEMLDAFVAGNLDAHLLKRQ